MSVRIIAQNFGPVRLADVELVEGMTVVVGPNGAGKSTLLRVVEFLRSALERSPADAASAQAGSGGLGHLAADASEMTYAKLQIGNLRYGLGIRRGPALSDFVFDERIERDENTLLRREVGERKVLAVGQSIDVGNVASLRQLRGQAPLRDEVERIAAAIETFASYASSAFSLNELMKKGSLSSTDRRLSTDGTNAFTVLRNWFLQRAHRHRFEFVVESLKRIFEDNLDDLDFEMAGDILAVRFVHSKHQDRSVSIARESIGVVHACLILVAIASSDDGGIIAVDELENSLHPLAIRRVVECIGDYAESHRIHVLVATHSPVLLDMFRESPERVYVMSRHGRPSAVRLDETVAREYLDQFSIGDLYASLDFGAPGVR